MIAIPFDTLVYTHKLMDTGMPREQAEKVAETQKEVFDAQNQHIQETLDKAISNHLATKEDVLNLKYELKHDTAKLDKKIDLLRKEFEGKFNLIYWMIGFNLAFSVAIVFKLYF